MSHSKLFSARTDDDIVRLIAENPLAWVFVSTDLGSYAAAVPLRPGSGESRLHTLVGHVPRQSKLHRYLSEPRQALILFLGPHGYISPSWFTNRVQAPTWNFVSAQCEANIHTVDDAAFLRQHLHDLTESMEHARPAAWHPGEMGDRFDRLAARIVGIEAQVSGWTSRFKLGQDELDETYQEIVAALERQASSKLAEWMRDYNAVRRSRG